MDKPCFGTISPLVTGFILFCNLEKRKKERKSYGHISNSIQPINISVIDQNLWRTETAQIINKYINK